MKLYQIRSNSRVYETFSRLKEAQQTLQKYAEERKDRFGVRCFESDENSFSFLLGWEEVEVKFWIQEVEVN
jgi:hypothetical protein